MDLKTLVKIQGTTRASVRRIISKWKNVLEENSEGKEDELMIILQKFERQTKRFKTNEQRSYYAT